MVRSKPSCPPEGNELEILTDGNKGQASKPNKYRVKKPWNKPTPEPKTKTDFQVWCTDLEGYTFDLGPRASNKFSRTMKELGRYIGTTYSDSCQPDIMTKTTSAFPTQRCLPSLIWALSDQKQMEKRPTSKKIISMRPSAKSLGRKIYTNQTCTRYTI